MKWKFLPRVTRTNSLAQNALTRIINQLLNVNARKTKLNKKWQQGRSGEDFTSWAHSRAIYNLAEVV
jgi:hypothetical protein